MTSKFQFQIHGPDQTLLYCLCKFEIIVPFLTDL